MALLRMGSLVSHQKQVIATWSSNFGLSFDSMVHDIMLIRFLSH